MSSPPPPNILLPPASPATPSRTRAGTLAAVAEEGTPVKAAHRRLNEALNDVGPLTPKASKGVS